jgi:hypothetical protein
VKPPQPKSVGTSATLNKDATNATAPLGGSPQKSEKERAEGEICPLMTAKADNTMWQDFYFFAAVI